MNPTRLNFTPCNTFLQDQLVNLIQVIIQTQNYNKRTISLGQEIKTIVVRYTW